jgi:AmmeMemoRadiSam system protein B
VLQDPLELAEKTVILPRELAPILVFCDGTRDLSELRAALIVRARLMISMGELKEIVQQLDEALLLENERSAEAVQAVKDAYRTASFRPASLAGKGYPAEPDDLQAMLDGYLEGVDGSQRDAIAGPCRALVSPHIDYQRGGPVYAQVWAQAAEAVRAAEVAVILGTDHRGGLGKLTLTRQHYATPFGILPTDRAAVDAMAAAIGDEAAFEEELNHRDEHSIELAAVWLHHMRDGEPCAVVPILTGSFYHFVGGEADPAADPQLGALLEALEIALEGREVIVVAAGDLAHIGPAFEGEPVDALQRARLRAKDQLLIDAICAGDAPTFFGAVQAEEDKWNVCGLPPIYAMLRLLGGAQGAPAGYDQCPADTTNTSFVSICGVTLT